MFLFQQQSVTFDPRLIEVKALRLKQSDLCMLMNVSRQVEGDSGTRWAESGAFWVSVIVITVINSVKKSFNCSLEHASTL